MRSITSRILAAGLAVLIAGPAYAISVNQVRGMTASRCVRADSAGKGAVATGDCVTDATTCTGQLAGTFPACTVVSSHSGSAHHADESAADLTTPGIVEIATVAETDTGTDATRCVSPAGLATIQTDVDANTAASHADEAAASLTVAGVVEIATVAETDTGTDATRCVSPAGLATIQTDVDANTAASHSVFAPTAGVSTDHGAGSITAVSDLAAGLCGTSKILEDQGGAWVCIDTPSAGGAPSDADYLVGTADPGLSAEIVVGPTPNGELGGTWGAITVDGTHGGSAHHADESAASTTVAGIIELATVAETDTGTAADRAVTPAGLATIQTDVDANTAASHADEAAASVTVAGIIELATVAETDTGTATDRAVTPAGLATIQTDVDANTAASHADESAADLTTPGIVEIATVAETDTGTDATRCVSPAGLVNIQSDVDANTSASHSVFTPTAGVSTDHGAGAISALSDLAAGLCGTSKILEDQGGAWVCIDTPSAGGAPSDADYLVGTADPGLSAEIVVGPTPNGELGGTWGAITVDGTHGGSAHHADEVAADLTTPGIIEIATVVETDAGADATRAVSPAGLVTIQTDVDANTAASHADEVPATLTVPGIIEIATVVETDAGADATRAVSPAGLATIQADVDTNTAKVAADDDLSDDLPTALQAVTTMTDTQFCQGNASGGFDCDVAGALNDDNLGDDAITALSDVTAKTGTGTIAVFSVSPALTGDPTVPTAGAGDSDTSAASTAYVQQEINGAGGTDLSCSAGQCNVDAAVARLASPTFTGNPLAPTPSANDDDTSIATTAFVQGEQENLERPLCNGIESLVAADDDMPFTMPGVAITLVNGWCVCVGTCSTPATIVFNEVVAGSGTKTAVTGTVTCDDMLTSGGTPAKQALTGAITIPALGLITFDTTNTPVAATDKYLICLEFTRD